ncbi:PPK2 family polyphosphate kinase [Kocuria sp.]|uniref:PPK2 family polyphosphate kinase n=1 Tax=Kocuria sp. TaxID=1871328 RepID=UPI00281274B6|nr:PPK2 family polyphosphate kinase [Kocuria sp.]
MTTTPRRPGAGFDQDVRCLLRAGPGLSLAAVDTGSTPGFSGGKTAGEALRSARKGELADLQRLLYANATAADAPHRLLLVLQGMDTSGKGGILTHVLGGLNPHGVHTHGFGRPTEEEAAQHFLHRVRRQLPRPGVIGAFDRSHYEDVLVPVVHGTLHGERLEHRYAEIRAFEQELALEGAVVVKVFLHLGRDAQRKNLLARLDDPAKRWKYDPADIDARRRWDAYRAAYEGAIRATDAQHAPWYVVPTDKKWYARAVVQDLLISALTDLGLDWPEPSYDVLEQRRLLARG